MKANKPALRASFQQRRFFIRQMMSGQLLLVLLCICQPAFADSSAPDEPRSAAPRTSATAFPETSNPTSPRNPSGSQSPLNATFEPVSSTPAQTSRPATATSDTALESLAINSEPRPTPATPSETNRQPEPVQREQRQPERPLTEIPVRKPSSSLQLLSAPPVQKTQSSQAPLVLHHEWLLSSVSIEAAQQAQDLLAPFGLKIKRRQFLPKLGFVISVYRVPEDIDAQALFEQVNRQFPELKIEFNQRFPLLSAAESRPVNIKQYGQHLTGMPSQGCVHFQGTLAIMDSKVNADLAEFSTFKLKTLDIPLLKKEAVSDHGTAVAYLLSQLLPKASLLAINVYKQTSENIETRSDWLLSGFELVLSEEERPSVLNMSFGGNPSKLLKRALDALAQQDIRLIAAAGNGGPQASEVYPAAYPNVVAVSALDIQKKLWPQSNRGEYLQFSAPGVDLWLLSAKGKKRYMSGTSFAAPWVSALAAISTQAQWQDPASLVKDLGQAGFDAHFGHGLIQFVDLCQR